MSCTSRRSAMVARQKIMLPFADTPVILRNKDRRRRSNTGLRGRRASSLIDSGLSNALPHTEVEVREFYKHIEQSLPELWRMKQLLTWCGARALPEKPSGHVPDTNAIMAGKQSSPFNMLGCLNPNSVFQHAQSSKNSKKISQINRNCRIGLARFVFPLRPFLEI